ncbi:MAG: HD domain-containing protein, partial [Butyricimonas faecihominis]
MAETTTYITVQQKYRSLLKSCKNLISTEDIRLVRKAFDTAMSSEANLRAVTEKDIHRLLDTGLIITSEIGLGRTSIICLMLHRAIESGTLKLEQIKTVFGEKVAQILAGLRDISHIYATHRVVDSENFRKLLLSFAEDVRVQLIFLAEKLYDLRHAETLLPEQQRELARETSYIYIPFAHRLGLYNIKSEMEDLALRYGEPEVYKEISLKLEGTREAHEKYINEFIAPIVEEFNNRGIKFKVKWRTKTIASILNKMRKKQVEFEEIYDIFAVRFILDSRGPEEKADCWRAYSIVADKYTPNPQRLRDWISVPKS